MKNAKAKVASQASSSSCKAETTTTAGVSADATASSTSHVQVSDNTVVDLTNDISDTPEESNSTVINAMVFTASPTPSRSSTPDFISSSDEEVIPITAEFSSDDDEVTASASLNHNDSILVDHTKTLPAFPAPTHSSGTGPMVSTNAHSNCTAVSSESQVHCSPRDIAQTPAFSPARPTKVRYPYTRIGDKKRCFNPVWYSKHDWLEYSIEEDACFCYPCRLFGIGSCGMTRPEPVFVSKGFRDWKHAAGTSGALSRHANCHSHTQALITWQQHVLNTKQGTTISGRMNADRPMMISNNRHYVKAICEVLLLCSRQEIGLRGHREGSDSLNRGNFLEILYLVAQHDPLVQRRLNHGPMNAKYTSPDIQNEVLGVMAGLIQEKICDGVRRAGYYSILADETKDCGKVEQLAVVLKYADIHTATQHEHF